MDNGNKSTPVGSPKTSNASPSQMPNDGKQEGTEGMNTEPPATNNNQNGQSSPRKKTNEKRSSSTLGTQSTGSISSGGSKGSLNVRIHQKPLRHDFTPKPYSFKMPGVSNMGIKNARVLCPPFHILLDHTIAVIWMLYSPKEPSKELGIVHLQWAISFLQAIRNRNGDNPDDVTMCLRAMQERVVELYSDINTFVVPEPPPPPPDPVIKVSEVKLTTFEKSLDQLKTDQDQQTRSRNLTCSYRHYPISITLKEMLGHHPEFLEEVFRNAENGACLGMVCPECKTPCLPKNQVTGTMKAVTEISQPGTSVSRTQMLGVLKNWRQEQVERIQEELKRLHSIEEFMFNLNKDNEDLIDDKVVEKIYAYEHKDEVPKKPD